MSSDDSEPSASEDGERAARTTLLSQTAEYALRAMAGLAGANGSALTALELAAITNIPVHYLSKVLRRLVAAGLLRSQRGHGGGFTLARSAAKISFWHVLEAVGSVARPKRCAFGWGTCDARRPCPLHPAWSRLDESFREWANRASLAEVRVNARTKRRSSRRT